MALYPVSNDEIERIKELFSYKILDTPVEKEFEDLVEIAVTVLNVPVAAITFIDSERQWTKAQHGLNICEMSREFSICNYTLLQEQVFQVQDLHQDERFKHFPYIAGEPFYRFYAGVPLITESGYKIGVFCVVDTEVRTLDARQQQTLISLARQSMRQVSLRLRNLKLEDQNERQRHISSRLSHDIKSPLSNIKMLLDMKHGYKDMLPEEEASRLNHLLSQQVDITIGMLDNMIKWGKMQLQGNDGRVQSVNLRRLTGEVMNEIALDSSKKQNIIVNAISGNINANVDSECVRFALRNLLTNANKFTSHGCITISHEHNNGKDYLHVADTGVGMSKEQIAKLNMNKQINSSYGTNNEKGNGLGLGLLQDYLAQHDGYLHFQSEIGKGTKASFTL